MFARLILSDWVGGTFMAVLCGSLVRAIRDEGPPTPSEAVSVYSSIVALGAWVLAKGVAASLARPGETGVSDPDGRDA
jgi:hypothetical protein